jgi:hypothetical protein
VGHVVRLELSSATIWRPRMPVGVEWEGFGNHEILTGSAGYDCRRHVVGLVVLRCLVYDSEGRC